MKIKETTVNPTWMKEKISLEKIDKGVREASTHGRLLECEVARDQLNHRSSQRGKYTNRVPRSGFSLSSSVSSCVDLEAGFARQSQLSPR
jgi:hypothetical protein